MRDEASEGLMDVEPIVDDLPTIAYHAVHLADAVRNERVAEVLDMIQTHLP